MVVVFRWLVLLLCVSFLMGGCADHPVRHLSSDVSMIKVGQSSRKDVQTYLGEPDSKQTVSGGREEWVYQEELRSNLQNLYVIGGFFSANRFSSIVITFDGDRVVDSQYRTSDEKRNDLGQ